MSQRTEQTPAAGTMPTLDEMRAYFSQKYGSLESVGWSPRRRFQFNYFLPAEYYEAVVSKFVLPGSRWLDVGGGRDIFPENRKLARELAGRCSKLTAVDPSENVRRNELAHECIQSTLEAFQTNEQYDLATMRMVVEHVSAPHEFTEALTRLVKPGGRVVVFTVNRWSPITIISGIVPFAWHHPIKRYFWGGEEEDTFPVSYRMNTRSKLLSFFTEAGFTEKLFVKLDDLSTLGRFKRLSYLELLFWKYMKIIGFHYPENCLLAVYERIDTDLDPSSP